MGEHLPLTEATQPIPFAVERKTSNAIRALRNAGEKISEARNLATLLETIIEVCREEFSLTHVIAMLSAEVGSQIYTVASSGYCEGISREEIAVDQGIIDAALHDRAPIRFSHTPLESSFEENGGVGASEVQWTSLLKSVNSASDIITRSNQIVLPIVVDSQISGVLYAESPLGEYFGDIEEDALITLASQIASMTWGIQGALNPKGQFALSSEPPEYAGALMIVRHFEEDDSIFIGEDYLIKGVAGAILWKMLREYSATGRTEFSNRELRRSSEIPLPKHSDNLEARLVLLRRRLGERCRGVGIEKAGRGKIRLSLDAPVKLLSE